MPRRKIKLKCLFSLIAHDALIHFAQTVMEIVNKNNLAQRTYRDDAVRTMNCEQIVPGNHGHLNPLLRRDL